MTILPNLNTIAGNASAWRGDGQGRRRRDPGLKTRCAARFRGCSRWKARRSSRWPAC